jgi:hypothetical protein
MNEFQHRVAKQIWVIAIVEAPFHFVEIGREMFRADLVPASNDAPLEERERRFNRVSRDARAVLVADIFFCIVVDGFVLSLADCRLISRQFVGNNYVYIGADVFFDVLRQRAFACILGMEEPEIAGALTNANDDFFLVTFSAPAVTVAVRLATNIGL